MNRFLRIALAALCAVVTSAGASAQGYPNRPIRFVIPFAPGGGTDIQIRLFSPKLAEQFGQQLVIENRPGAGSVIGTELVVRSPADGYTFVMVDTALISNPAILPKLPYDTVKDLVPVVLATSGASAFVVHPSVPAKTLNEFVELAKEKKGALSYASAGAATASHLTGELFKLSAGIDLIHVPYKGAGPAVADTVAGQVTATFTSIVSSKSFLDSGKLRALAVTGDTRSVVLPNVPTFSESGLPAVGQASSYWGVLAPAGTPREIVARVNAEFNKVMNLPEIRTRLTDLGYIVVGGPPEVYANLIRDGSATWKRVAEQANIRVD